MHQRAADILTAAIRYFIETGEPVSSGELYRRHGFHVKPATIRNELADLDEAGFLIQPHTSAGRVPTDKGYIFFVEMLIDVLKDSPEPRMPRKGKTICREFRKGSFNDFVSDFAESLQLLGVGYETQERSVYKSGLEDLVDGLVAEGELQNLEEVRQIVGDFEAMDERLNDLMNFIPHGVAPRVFIGKSPITRSPHLSVIADTFQGDDGDEFVLAAVGSKRMDYENNLKFFWQLRKNVKNKK